MLVIFVERFLWRIFFKSSMAFMMGDYLVCEMSWKKLAEDGVPISVKRSLPCVIMQQERLPQKFLIDQNLLEFALGGGQLCE